MEGIMVVSKALSQKYVACIARNTTLLQLTLQPVISHYFSTIPVSNTLSGFATEIPCSFEHNNSVKKVETFANNYHLRPDNDLHLRKNHTTYKHNLYIIHYNAL